MTLTEWLQEHGRFLTAEARTDLHRVFNAPVPATLGDGVDMGETAMVSRIRLEASRYGYHLWRNNSGAGYMKDGRFIRWGLANDSPQVNAIVKSSDLIGVGPRGQFVAREVKRGDWKYTGTPRERAQKAFIDLVNAKGGDAQFVTGEGSFK